jgi:hypothetical protein
VPWTPVTPDGGTVTLPSGHPIVKVRIDPAAMPAGAALSVGDFQLSSGQQQASLVLIDTSSYTCTSVPPGPDGPPGGVQIVSDGSITDNS